MTVIDHKDVAYECRNGHVNTDHDFRPSDSSKGFIPVCSECGERIARKLVPLFKCEDCGNVWPYTGNADRPTCSNCRGKRTMPVSKK